MRKKIYAFLIILIVGIAVYLYLKKKREGSDLSPQDEWPGRTIILPGQQN